MTDHPAESPSPAESPVGDRTDVPVPRIGTPATETTEESVHAEREATADEPDAGGLTPPDDAQ